ncbi:hypothetical protein [Pseudomonas aeruginosa]|uniref:hypothetical protein n=1 Tax=Pseudomonas aeruginosa TaxID=287 RepID=UPI00178238B1|nr:hypothetical protein [Pseudomonas aeruginosa]
MNVVRKCLGASRRALCGLAARLLAKAAHLLMVVSVRAYASGRLSQVEVRNTCWTARARSTVHRSGWPWVNEPVPFTIHSEPGVPPCWEPSS